MEHPLNLNGGGEGGAMVFYSKNILFFFTNFWTLLFYTKTISLSNNVPPEYFYLPMSEAEIFFHQKFADRNP